ncbi:TonB-dependent receptor plug domain-containing protein [Sandaracinus amylolyticus]|uniref:TonB-dependent receptor plug domain-containing protein n=1 Tax=Sandaracinus amylolyticus TaxID=927083 RepID=UPI00069D4E55|nr:TonB-dependent receptor [Sandaracinus amylolyticus]
MRRFPALAVSLSIALCAAHAHAQSGDTAPREAPPECPPDDELCTSSVVVSATRTEVAQDDSPVRVEVIDRATIERSGARDLGELLEEQPGMLVTRSFRGDAIQMQGLDPEHVLVIVDGERVPGRVGGAIDLGRYGLEDVERVEIVRGGSSALYGSDAIAGVIHVITRRTRDELELDASASGGGGEGGGIADATARAGARLGDVSLRLSGGFHWAEPFRRGGDPTIPEDQRATDGSARLQWSVGGDVRWRVDPTLSLDARAEYMQRGLSGVDRNDAGAVFDRAQLAEQLQSGLGASWALAGAIRLVTRASYAIFREQYLRDQRGASALDEHQDHREDLGQLLVQLDIPVDTHLLTFGFEELFQRLESDRLDGVGTRFRASPFVQDEWTVIDDDVRLVLVPGVRVDADSQYGTQLSPKLAVRFDPVRQLVLRASFGTGFRAPSFQELLLRFENPTVGYVVLGNPDLGPETSRSYQLGAEWTPITELRGSLSLFRNDVDGLITTITAEESPDGTLFTYDNVASATTQGIESSLTARPIRELSLAASYTFTHAWDHENDRALEGRAAHRITLSATFDHREWDLGATARCALTGERPFYVDEELIYSPWAAQLDLRIYKRFERHLEISAGIDNVLDAGDAYLPLRPRTFYGGIRGRL